MNPFRRGPVFYGWVIVASMFLVNYSTMASGTLNFGPFVVPMGEGLDMSRADFRVGSNHPKPDSWVCLP